jgi:ureidoacrylate peracid hydrolase
MARKISVLREIYKWRAVRVRGGLRPLHRSDNRSTVERIIASEAGLAYNFVARNLKWSSVWCEKTGVIEALGGSMIRMKTKPEGIEVDASKAAVVVVDMQNAFASKGGLLDIAGVDISGAAAVVRKIVEVVERACACGIPVVYLQMGYKPDQSNSGGPNSPNWHKELAMTLMNRRPELMGKLLTEGTWDFEIVEELKPRPEDLVVVKTRYSGFAGTPLDSMLRTRGIRYLFFAGIATNVCVESTLRDAYFLDYWPILLSDGAMPAGPASAHEATLFNVESFFGWSLKTEDFLEAVNRPGS